MHKHCWSMWTQEWRDELYTASTGGTITTPITFNVRACCKCGKVQEQKAARF